VACPSGPLEQVLLNLLLNAGEAARDTGSPHVDVFAEAADGRVRIRLKDNGPGIAPEDLSRLFDPFFTRGSGTGLGLSVSYGILKAVGGDLRAANDAAGGACFTIELPIA